MNYFQKLTILLALSVASHVVAGRALANQTRNSTRDLLRVAEKPSSVLRLSSPRCTEAPFEYFDLDTMSCESCGVICGQGGRPRSEQCQREPNCKVDGRWNCEKTDVCQADCQSPTSRNETGDILWHGVANCVCEVQLALGGRPCQGFKQINCTVDISTKCDSESEKTSVRRWNVFKYTVSAVITIVAIAAIIIAIGFNRSWFAPCSHWFKTWRMNRGDLSRPVQEEGVAPQPPDPYPIQATPDQPDGVLAQPLIETRDS